MEVSLSKKIPWWEPGDWVEVLALILIVVPMLLASDWFLNGRFVPLGQSLLHSEKALGVLWQITVLLLAAATVAEGVLFNLRARSVKMILLWLMYVPVIVGLCLWKLTHSGTWLAVALAGCSLVWVQRYNARRRGF